MEKESNGKCCRKENDSLGILSMENIKVFGESTGNASTGSTNSRISDRLNMERYKAFETLQKFDKSKRHYNGTNKENFRVSGTLDQTPSATDKSDFVPYRRPNTINISDLVTDETINLENSSLASNQERRGKNSNISFEPAEITGRSTLNKRDQSRVNNLGSNLSVADILASSFAKKARDLSDTLRSGDITIGSIDQPTGVRRACSMANSSMMSYNGVYSLPRTADMSHSKFLNSELSLIGGEGFSFSSGQSEQSKIDEENFESAEIMMKKLILDEISWAEEFAAIPAATLSKQAKQTANKAAIMTSNPFDSTQSTSHMLGDPNFSVGTFFNMRSENISDMVASKSPDKFRKPIALVDDEDSRSSIASATSKNQFKYASTINDDVEVTPKVDNKTYTRLATGTVTRPSKKSNERHESKDSGRDTQNSYQLSLSAIDRAMCFINIETDNSDVGVIQQVLSRAKSRSPSRHSDKMTRRDDCMSTIADVLSENKENLDPDVLRSATLSDTLDFTDSLLNSSEMKQLHGRNTSQSRSPLSPLNTLSPLNRFAPVAGHDADIDDWSTTPVKASNRRVRRTKSPRDASPKPSSNDSEITSSEDKTPMRSKTPQCSCPKSLCSTRLDGAAAECDLGISPNISRNASPNITVTAPNANTISAHVRNNSLTISHAASSPTLFQTNSPMSSPRSGMSSPSGNVYRSPRLDSTTNSERRYLSAGAVHKASSSPVASESGTSSYGVPPMRTYSSASQRSTTANGRSISRCSNSSEFSHRDGKIIPLKVTTLELSWGSTKLRTDARKTMQVKNISSKRLVVRLAVHGPGFQIANSQGNALTLQSQECRSIIISFCPTVTGIAIGALCFYSPLGTTTVNTPFLEIPLYAYGGHAAIVPQNMLKGPIGASFMPMGDVCELAHPLERTFHIFNRGPLMGFAHISIDSLGSMMPRLNDAFEVNPTCILIAAGQSAAVNVVFRPRREDTKKIIKKIQQVLTLANMRIICGDEANRQRMRRLSQRMTADERSKISSTTLDKLWLTFPNEVEVADFDAFNEQPDVIIDLISCMRIQEIALTINCDGINDTIVSTSLYYPDADDTVLFRTICAASPVPNMNQLEPVDEALETTNCCADEERAISSTQESRWSVHPSILEFDFSANRKTCGRVSLLIRNSYKSQQYFEVTCNRKNLLSMTPSTGNVAADGGQVLIEVRPVNESKLIRECSMEADISLMVHMENERITVPVKVYQ